LPGARFTSAFERHAIDVLLEADVLGGTRLLHLSWDEAWNIMERAVARGLRAKKRRIIAHLGVDEKAVAKRHRYVTLVCDLDRATVEYIGDDRKQVSLDAYYQSCQWTRIVTRLVDPNCYEAEPPGSRRLPPQPSCMRAPRAALLYSQGCP
jgi:transposase